MRLEMEMKSVCTGAEGHTNNERQPPRAPEAAASTQRQSEACHLQQRQRPVCERPCYLTFWAIRDSFAASSPVLLQWPESKARIHDRSKQVPG